MHINYSHMRNLLLINFFLITSVWAQDHVRIHVLPPLLPLDWSTPRSLFKTAFKNRWEDRTRPFGHVYVDLTCDNKNLVTSIRSKNFNPISEFIFEGRGLSVLYLTYEGALESGGRLERELEERKKEGKMLFMDFSLSKAHCERMLTYFEEFKKLNVARGYGLPHRPLYGEGGNDASYAVSFLDVAGVINEREKEDWRRSVNIPLAYAGAPITDESVNFMRVLLFGMSEWAPENVPHRKLQTYDPQKMYNWIFAEIQAKRQGCEDESARGICLDTKALPAKTGEIWLQHTDPSYSRTK